MIGNIKMINVTSSQIQSIGYDDEKNELHIIFNNTKRYIYLNVPKEIYNQFLSSDSIGKTFNKLIKNNYKIK